MLLSILWCPTQLTRIFILWYLYLVHDKYWSYICEEKKLRREIWTVFNNLCTPQSLLETLLLERMISWICIRKSRLFLRQDSLAFQMEKMFGSNGFHWMLATWMEQQSLREKTSSVAKHCLSENPYFFQNTWFFYQ